MLDNNMVEAVRVIDSGENDPPEAQPPLVYRPGPPTAEQNFMHGSRGLTQMFGLHVSAAVLTVLVDLMLFGGDVITGGMMIPVGFVVASVLGVIVYRLQRHSYGDQHETALIKALIVGLLTAIPVPLTPLVAIPGGLLGVARSVARRFKS